MKTITKKVSTVLRGASNNLYPDGRLYLAEYCFETEEEAMAKLKSVIQKTIEQNEILIENLNGENNRLSKKLEELYGRK